MKKTIFITGFIAGAFDALGAVIIFLSGGGKDPLIIFKYIASGLFRRDAFAGGIPMIVCGFIFHFIFAMGWTAIFFLLCKRYGRVPGNWIITGIVYGVVVWMGMNLLVVPLSRLAVPPFDFGKILIAVATLIICIGLPVSFSADRYFKKA